MQRLIDDANRIKEANGEMADLSIDSFADIVEAIHEVQTEMYISGITQEEADKMVADGLMSQEDAYKLLGTTAKEAATTISGSQGMMNAAWENLLTGLGREDVNLDDLIDALLESVQTYIDNLVPVVKRIFDSVWKKVFNTDKTLDETMKPFIDGITTFWEEDVSPLVEKIGTSLNTLKTEVGEPLAELLDGALKEAWNGLVEVWDKVVMPILTTLVDDFTWLLDNVLTPIGEYLVDKFASAWDSLTEGWSTTVSPALDGFADKWQTFHDDILVPFATWLGEKFLAAWEDLTASWDTTIAPAIDTLSGKWDTFYTDVLTPFAEWLGDAFVDAWEGISDFWSTTLEPAIDDLGEDMDDLWESYLKPLATALGDTLLKAFKDLKAYWTTYLFPKITELKTKFDDFWTNTGKPFASFLIDTLLKAFQDIKKYWVETFQPKLQDLMDKVGEFHTTYVEPLATAIGTTLLNVFTSLKDFIVDTLIPKIGDLVTAFDDIWNGADGLGTKIKAVWDDVLQPFATFLGNTLGTAIEGIKTTLEAVGTFLTDVFQGNWESAWITITNLFGDAWNNVIEFVKAPLNTAIGYINQVINWLNGKLNSIWSAVQIPAFEVEVPVIGKVGFGGFGLSNIAPTPQISTIEALARGGNLIRGSALVGEAGPELLTLEAGKAIVRPLTQSQRNDVNSLGQSFTFNIYTQQGQSPEEIARAVQREFILWERQRQAVM